MQIFLPAKESKPGTFAWHPRLVPFGHGCRVYEEPWSVVWRLSANYDDLSQIDRASAGAVKRSKEEKEADPEEEDDFGYTTSEWKDTLFTLVSFSFYLTHVYLYACLMLVDKKWQFTIHCIKKNSGATWKIYLILFCHIVEKYFFPKRSTEYIIKTYFVVEIN